MTSKQTAGSALTPQVIELQPVQGPSGKPPAHHEESKALGIGSFSTTYQWRGNGSVLLNLRSGWIWAGSRVVASVSEYNTGWNVDRFIGAASMQVLNVSPYNGGCWVWLSVNWGGPINNCITLFVDP